MFRFWLPPLNKRNVDFVSVVPDSRGKKATIWRDNSALIHSPMREYRPTDTSLKRLERVCQNTCGSFEEFSGGFEWGRHNWEEIDV
jgi:hypothetical protein